MGRSILAMLLGLLALNAIVIASAVTLQLFGLLPADHAEVTPAFRAVTLLSSVVGGMFAGVVCAMVAGRAPLAHAAALAMTVFFISIGDTHRLWTATPPANPPHWYLLVLMFSAPVGILAGGLWQRRRALRFGPPQPQEERP